MDNGLYNNQNDSNGYDNNSYNNGYNNNGYDGYDNNGYNGNGYNNGYNPYNNQSHDNDNKMGIVSLVMGIISLILSCCCTYLGILLGAAAVIFGIVSIRKQENTKGLAIAGIITGALGIVLAIVGIIMSVMLMNSGFYDEFYKAFMDEYQREMLK